MKKIFLLSLLPAALIAACAAQPSISPTLSAEDQNIIASAVALTVMAKDTAAAETIPTLEASATPFPTLPVTIVTAGAPVMTFTPEVQGSVTETAQATSNSSEDDCKKILKVSDAGPLTNVRLKNKTGGQVRVGIHLWKENIYGQCGFLPNNPISIGKDQSYTVRLPEGAYFAWAWITFKNGETSPVHGNFTNSSNAGGSTIEIIIQKSGISG